MRFFHPLSILVIASALLLSGVAGCASCCHDNPSIACRDKVKTVTTSGITATYTYDTTGRLVLIARSDGSSTSYTYATGSVTETNTPAGGAASSIVFALNADGLAISDSRGTTYQYDSNGYTIKTVYSSFTDSRTIVNGNIVVETRDGSSPVTYNVSYTPLRDCQDYGLSFLGKQSRNLRQTQFATDGTPPINYIYEFANGKLVTRTATGGASLVSTFTYY